MESSRLRQARSLWFGLWTGAFSPLCTSGVNRATLDEVGSESGMRGLAWSASATFPFPSARSGAGDPPTVHRPQSCLWITVRDAPAEGSPHVREILQSSQHLPMNRSSFLEKR